MRFELQTQRAGRLAVMMLQTLDLPMTSKGWVKEVDDTPASQTNKGAACSNLTELMQGETYD